MSWTTLKGHHPVGPVERERPSDQPDEAPWKPLQRCICGCLYDAAHVAECIAAQELGEAS